LKSGGNLITKVKARKPLYSEAMVTYATKLRRDQVECLQKVSNAAELMRSWTDKGLADVLGDREPILIARKVAALEARITELRNAPDYKRARTMTLCHYLSSGRLSFLFPI